MIGIDLGSNTIRFIEYCREKEQFVNEYEKVVRTAEFMHESSEISQNALERVVQAIREAKKIMNFQDVTAVATAAFRNASNQNEAKEYIFQKTGVEFVVISSEIEAKLTTLAVKEESKNFFTNDALMIDIGGASTEIAVFHKDAFFYKSFDLGIVLCSERFKNSKDLKEFINSKQDEIQTLLHSIDKNSFTIAATAGTPTTLAALKHGLNFTTYDKRVVSGTTLTIEEIKDLKGKFANRTQEELKELVGVGREDLIYTGVTIFIEILKLLGKKSCFVFDNSLREGIIYGKLKGLF